MGRGVVQHDVQRAARVGLHELVEECEELLVAVLLVAGAGDLAGRDLKRGVEAGCAVALVVVSHHRGLPRLHRKRRLRAIECLDLRFLVHAQHQRAFRRIEVEPDDVDHLLDQLRVLGELERADLVGLELVIAPDPVHRRRGDAGHRREPADAPMRGPVRRRLERLGEHPLHLVIIDLPGAPRPRCVNETVQPTLAEVTSPQPNRRQRHTHLSRDLRVRRALRRAQHDPCPYRLLVRRRRLSQHRA